MVGQIQELSDSQLHWFWKLTTKWWFFPVFYLFLILLYLIINFNSFDYESSLYEQFIGILSLVLIALIYMPSGLGYLIHEIFTIRKDYAIYLTPIFFHPLWITMAIIIVYFKNKKNKILKWLILTLLLLMILSFSGCIIGGFTGFFKF